MCKTRQSNEPVARKRSQRKITSTSYFTIVHEKQLAKVVVLKKTVAVECVFNVSNKLATITAPIENMCMFNSLFQSLRTPELRLAFCNNNRMHPTSAFFEVTKNNKINRSNKELFFHSF
jgi:hypothetical protein